MNRLKNERISERLRKALDTIKHGDRVRFYDCFEAQIYKDKTFYVISENPMIYETKYGVEVMVKLQGLGLFPLERLVRVEEPCEFSDEEIRKALVCCTKAEPDCVNCPYKFLGASVCSARMDKDSENLLRRIETFVKAKGVNLNASDK